MTRRLCQIAVLLALAGGGCAAEIGDDCGYDVDCSPNMNRNCDRNQPGGYCLILGCDPDTCPSEAVCVEFTTPCPDGTDVGTCAQLEENRERTYCLRHCGKNGDCRSGYACVVPQGNVLDGEEYALVELENATIIDLDYNPEKKWGICVPAV
jgi:hypothetical protein